MWKLAKKTAARLLSRTGILCGEGVPSRDGIKHRGQYSLQGAASRLAGGCGPLVPHTPVSPPPSTSPSRKDVHLWSPSAGFVWNVKATLPMRVMCRSAKIRYAPSTTTGTGHSPMDSITDHWRPSRSFCHSYCLPDGHKEVLTCQGDKAYAGPCPLYPFRMGKNPNRKPLSDERRLALVEAGKKTRFSPGVNGLSQAPESKETAQPMSHPELHENNTNNTYQSKLGAGRRL